MKFQIAVVALAKLLSVTSAASSEQDSEPFNLIKLGSVDGKNYFYNKDYRTWFESRTFCMESGMKLASIETASQAAFLKTQHNTSTFFGNFWTSGRDAQMSRQFSWDDSETEPTDSIGLPWGAWEVTLEYQTCVLYYSNAVPKFLIHICGFIYGYTLCET
ncbi:C-type lectin lectoxin-Enh7 [Orchesella cincta]|uniref:C-type lectin lectoxin-Enh7 n=1 Tax=Orchesella cincta TaxID=48709 RepID=A0A1D2M6L1_ORCCI|nr:C-type lectin lectoxin-Enh7 [Orchesella cincta]